MTVGVKGKTGGKNNKLDNIKAIPITDYAQLEIFALPSGKDWNDYIKMTGKSKQS